jgi:hypothetical protein
MKRQEPKVSSQSGPRLADLESCVQSPKLQTFMLACHIPETNVATPVDVTGEVSQVQMDQPVISVAKATLSINTSNPYRNRSPELDNAVSPNNPLASQRIDANADEVKRMLDIIRNRWLRFLVQTNARHERTAITVSKRRPTYCDRTIRQRLSTGAKQIYVDFMVWFAAIYVPLENIKAPVVNRTTAARGPVSQSRRSSKTLRHGSSSSDVTGIDQLRRVVMISCPIRSRQSQDCKFGLV